MKGNLAKGHYGEWLAGQYITQQGCEIIARGFRTRFGEMDLIATRAMTELHFVEVKYRTQKQFGEPFEAVDFRKLQRLKRLAEFYLLKHEGLYNRHSVHFSVVSIFDAQDRAPTIEWLKIEPFSF